MFENGRLHGGVVNSPANGISVGRVDCFRCQKGTWQYASLSQARQRLRTVFLPPLCCCRCRKSESPSRTFVV